MNKLCKKITVICLSAILLICMNSQVFATEVSTVYYELPAVRSLNFTLTMSISDVVYETRYGLDEISRWDAWADTLNRSPWWNSWREQFEEHLQYHGDIPVFYTNGPTTITLPAYGMFYMSWTPDNESIINNLWRLDDVRGEYVIYWLVWQGFSWETMIAGDITFTEPGTYLVHIPSMANPFKVIGLVVGDDIPAPMERTK